MLISFEIVSALLAMFILMTMLWAYQVKAGEADIVDAGWAGGLGMVAIYFALSLPGDEMRRLLLAIFAGSWSARLTSFLLSKRVFVAGEDGRYKNLRSKWGRSAKFNFFLFFQAQGLLVIILAIPFFVAASNIKPGFSAWDVAAVIIFIVALCGESIADSQLEKFKSKPENNGKTCRYGLWKYSRHPNYFFEWLHWWSYVFLSIGSPVFLWSLIGPVLMLFLILKVSGIPPAERQAILSRGDDYRKYQKSTSAFFPWFTKEN